MLTQRKSEATEGEIVNGEGNDFVNIHSVTSRRMLERVIMRWKWVGQAATNMTGFWRNILKWMRAYPSESETETLTGSEK